MAAKSMLDLDKQSKKQMLTWASMVQSGNLINTSLVKQKLGYDTLSRAKQAAIDSTIKQYAVDQNGILIEKEKVNALIAKASANAKLSKTITQNAQKEMAATLVTQQHTTSIWNQLKANLALMASNPMTWITIAISGFAALANYIGKTQERLEEAYQQSATSYKETATKVEDLTNKIRDLNDEIDTLNGPNLSLSDNSRLNTLEQERDALQTQLDIEIELAKVRKNQAYQEFYKTASGQLNQTRGETSGHMSLPDARKLLIQRLSAQNTEYNSNISSLQSSLNSATSDSQREKIIRNIAEYQSKISGNDAQIQQYLQDIVQVRDGLNKLAEEGDIRYTFNESKPPGNIDLSRCQRLIKHNM